MKGECVSVQVRYEADAISVDMLGLMMTKHPLISVSGPMIRKESCNEHSMPVTFVSEAAYLLLPTWTVTAPTTPTIPAAQNTTTTTTNSVNNLQLSFRTTETNGLLCFHSSSASTSTQSYFAVEIVDGLLFVIFGVIEAPAVRLKVSPEPVSDGLVHRLSVSLSGAHATVAVDLVSLSVMLSASSLRSYDFGDRFYLGGVDTHSERLPLHVWTGALRYGYVGCVHSIWVDRQAVDVARLVVEQRVDGVKEGCRQHHQDVCNSSPCYHGGLCTEGWNRFICDCLHTGYHGISCQSGDAPLLARNTRFA